MVDDKNEYMIVNLLSFLLKNHTINIPGTQTKTQLTEKMQVITKQHQKHISLKKTNYKKKMKKLFQIKR